MAAAPEPDFWNNYQPVQHVVVPADPAQGVEVDDLYGPPQPGGRRRRSKGRRSRRSKGRMTKKVKRRSKVRKSRRHRR